MLLIIVTILLIPLALFTEGGNVIIPFILITYFFRGNNKWNNVQLRLFILVVSFMLMYNGEKGMNNKFSKYLFYVFYPLYLWLIAIVEFLLK